MSVTVNDQKDLGILIDDDVDFWVSQDGFLGHVIFADDIRVDPSKISATVNKKAPKNVQICIVF